MLSAANLAMVLLLIRYTEADQYGYFVLVQVTLALLTSAQGAWVLGPLMVLAPKRTTAQRDHLIGEVSSGLNRFLLRALPVALAAPVLAALLRWCSWEHAALGLSAVLAAIFTLHREFARSALRIQSRTRELLIADAVYVVLLLAGAGVAVSLPGSAAVWAVLALAAAATVGDGVARRAVALPPSTGLSARRAARHELRPLGVWATMGAVIYWVQSQSFNFALAAKLSVMAVAHINAARLMLMPVFLLSTGVVQLLLPSAAGWLHNEGLPRLVRRMWKFFAVLLLLDLFYLGVLWLARDWITGDLMQQVIPDRDLLILLWAGHALLGMTRELFQVVLLALGQFRALAWLSVLAAVAALATMWFGVQAYGAPGAIMGTACGELVFLAGLAILLPQSMRRDRAERAALSPPPQFAR